MTGAVEAAREAVRVHSAQAEDFAARYRRIDPYESCFAYSRHRLDHWLDSFLGDDGEGRRLLDLGCGTGHYLARYFDKGFAVVGIDGSAAMLRQARVTAGEAPLERGAVDALPFRDATFDVVMAIEVLRYLPDATACVREAARVLKPRGLFIATACPRLNLNGYWPINRLAARLPLPGMVRLRQYFTTSWALRRTLVEAGFASPELHGVYFGPLNWLERLAGRVLPAFLRSWEPIDRRLADRGGLRELSNMFVVRALRAGAER
jgi:ubiquinone/menaquinone biosynthesis C-methylase UbiE